MHAQSNRESDRRRGSSHRRPWRTYAAAAGGAAVSLGASDAHAVVHYFDVPNVTSQFVTNSNDSIVLHFDVDAGTAGSGISSARPAETDFTLGYSNDNREKPDFNFASGAGGWAKGQVAKAGENLNYAARFGPNEIIGPAYNPTPINVTDGTIWANGGWLENNIQDREEDSRGVGRDPWHEGGVGNVSQIGTGFVGFRLDFDGAGAFYNYGWAQIRYNDNADTITLLDFAYEEQLDTAITTPAATTGPAAIEGDFDDSGLVDAADLALWQADYGIDGLGGVINDVNNPFNGQTEGIDAWADGPNFLEWQRNLGATRPAVGIAAVPEPAALGLLAFGAAGLGALRRRKA